MRMTYFVNQYPKVSHSFIRREILALERQGIDIQRVALRGWDGELVDADDLSERKKTQYVLKGGIAVLLLAALRLLLMNPSRFLKTLIFALKMSRHADRPWPYHLIYLTEACRILPWLKAFGSTHVHAHFGTNSTEVVMLARVLGGPSYSFTVHGPEEFDKPQFIHLREKIHHAAFVVAISSYGRSQLYRWLDYSQWHKVNVVHCGLESDFYDVSPKPIPNEPRLVCVGRLCEQKGQLLLIEAARRLVEKNISFHLVLAGDGEMRQVLEQLITDYGLNQQITITGWISSNQVREELLNARGLVLPSFAEGLPVVIMEAMALKRPVLTTYVAGIPELVIPGENGWLFPAGSVEALTAALEAILATPLTALQVMGNAGFERVVKRHSIDTEAEKLATLFKDVAT